MTERLSGTPPQRGIALISVLLLLAFVLTLVAGLFYRHQLHIHKVSRTVTGDQALLLVLGAESWVLSELARDGRDSDIDHPGEPWARPLPPLPVEGGELSGCLQDQSGLFNLNNLGWYTNSSWDLEMKEAYRETTVTTRRTFFRDLLAQLGRDGGDARIAALADWVDADRWVLGPDSAEDNEYLLRDPPYRPANHPLAELGELPLVQGFSTADVTALGPYVSTLPSYTRLNVNTAPDPVLAALSPLITTAQLDALKARRPFATVGEFYDALADVAGQPRERLLTQIPALLLDVRSDYFALRARVSLGGLRFDYHSLLYRPQGGDPGVVSRTFTPVPRLAAIGNSDAPPGDRHPCQLTETPAT